MRVFEFEVDASSRIKLASMTVRQAEEHVKRGQELSGKTPAATSDEWFSYACFTVTQSLKRAGGDDVTEDWLKDNFDIPTINAMFVFIRDKSGLKAGEVKAA